MKSVAAKANTRSSPSFGRKAAWAVIIVLLLLVLALVVIPMRVIHPFRPQTPEGLELAYALRGWAPVVTLIASVIIIALTLGSGAALAAGGAKLCLSSLSPCQSASHGSRGRTTSNGCSPLNPTHLRAGRRAGFVDESDSVIAIEINGDAVAYPIRQIAYHHVVQDTVGGMPVVATY